MRICGISIESNNINLSLIESMESSYQLIPIDQKKISIDDDCSQQEIRDLHLTLQQFVSEYEVDYIGVKARLHKGKFAGGAVSFKIESIIQLLDCKVTIIPTKKINSKTKNIDIPSELFKYQQDPFRTAYTLLRELGD